GWRALLTDWRPSWTGEWLHGVRQWAPTRGDPLWVCHLVTPNRCQGVDDQPRRIKLYPRSPEARPKCSATLGICTGERWRRGAWNAPDLGMEARVIWL